MSDDKPKYEVTVTYRVILNAADNYGRELTSLDAISNEAKRAYSHGGFGEVRTLRTEFVRIK